MSITRDPIIQLSSTLNAPRRIIDLTTGLPSLTSLYSDFAPVVEDPAGMTLLYVHLASNALIEERFGWEALEAYIGFVASFLSRFGRDMQRERSHCVVARAYADDYVVALPYREGDERVSSVLIDGMNRHVQAMDAELATLHEVYVGMARVMNLPKVHSERLVYRGIQRAQAEATDVGRQRLAVQIRTLDRCITEEASFCMHYQPIVRMADNSVFAYEALVRCSDEALRNPHVLFNVAEQSDRVWSLTRLLRRLATQRISELPEEALLFVNIHPLDFGDLEFLNIEKHILDHSPRIVFEITERVALLDFESVRKSCDVLRQSNLRIAIDDLGSGYAALSTAAELNPDFFKFDITLIRDIDKSAVRQNLVRNMVAFATEAGAQVVAEGIETKEEYDVVKELGCQFAQGFYLARPALELVRQIPDAC